MEDDKKFIQLAIDAAAASRDKGNLPFGCVLVSAEGNVLLTGENSINTDKDCLAHAEINLIRTASKTYDHGYLKTCSIYTSDEPCPMCISAIYWSGIGRLVYGLRKSKYYEIVGRENPDWVFEIPVAEVLKYGGRRVEVLGPLLEEEAAKLHRLE